MNALVAANQNEDIIGRLLAGRSANTKIAYGRHLANFQAWSAETNNHDFSRAAVMAWKDHLIEAGDSAATVNQALAAIRAAAKELAYYGLDHAAVQAILDIPGLPKRGNMAGRWLSKAEVGRLLAVPDTDTLKGQQERLVLVMLVGTALRREELASLTFEDIQQLGDTWVIANLVGKGGRVRTIPLAPWVKEAIDQWKVAAGVSEGLLLRAINKGDKLAGQLVTRGGRLTNGGLTDQAIYAIVVRAAKAIGIKGLGPHSLRRTWARLVYQQDTSRLAQISLILGHESIRTTEVYLGLHNVDLENPVTLDIVF